MGTSHQLDLLIDEPLALVPIWHVMVPTRPHMVMMQAC